MTEKETNFYTRKFLDGNLKQPVLYDIILLNQWDSKQNKMEVLNSTASGFYLYCGTDFAYQVKCKKNFKNFEWPYATKGLENIDKSTGGIF